MKIKFINGLFSLASYIKFPGGPGSCFCTARNISRWTPRGFWWPRSPYWPSICIQFFCIEDPIPGAHRILIHAVPKSARPRPLNKRCCLKPPPKPNVLKHVQTSSCGFNSTRLEKKVPSPQTKTNNSTFHNTVYWIEQACRTPILSSIHMIHMGLQPKNQHPLIAAAPPSPAFSKA